ncbi:MAG: tripartite tricarboxylate transporter permease [Treponema sp.]|jgi:putative tricarboxylic transport membrane protein|nr:tripartite tricarboxylate transporter permease [Treponema sp.]
MEWLISLRDVVSFGVLVYAVLGVLVGMFIGMMPGLTSTMAIAILTPLTFWLEPTRGFAMLIGVYNSALFAGGISAIVINTPGTPASIATSFDGYGMTKRGRASLALSLNTICSVIGGILSTLLLIVAAFPLANFVLKFGPSEFFWLALFGLIMMVSVSQGSMIKGLLLGSLGLLLSTIGLDPMLSSQRFTFNNINLMDGVSFIPVMIGIFGVGEMAYQIFTWKHIKEENTEDEVIKGSGSMFPTAKELKRITPPTFISALIGIIIGAIPGAGGDIASIVSWDVSKKLSKHPEEFGNGSIEGVAGTCSANNASIGGALTTALTLGVPGDSNTAVLLGTLMMYGMVPGPTLFSGNGQFVRNLMLLMIVANILILIIGLLMVKVSVKILNVRKEAIWMAVFILCCVGSYALNKNFFDVLVMFVSGILGFFFRKMDFPLGPFILGLLLGNLCETNMRRALTLSQGSYMIFVRNPISVVLICLIILSLFFPLIQKRIKAARS